MMPHLKRLLTEAYHQPAPLRTACGLVIGKLRLFPYELRVDLFWERKPAYAYCLLNGARLAKRLGVSHISAIEFGVASGKGLMSLEYHATQVEKALGIKVDVYGFDSGEGMPEPVDHHDLPYHWKGGFFRMDKPKLLSRLSRSKLILGDVRDTVPQFLRDHDLAPLAFVSFDLDFYSATKAALQVLDARPEHRLPRLFTYFDDVIGSEVEMFNDYTGELLALKEYNREHSDQKLSQARYFVRRCPRHWHHQIFIHHDFVHPRYIQFISEEDQQLPIK
jgi:hypothetical protein